MRCRLSCLCDIVLQNTHQTHPDARFCSFSLIFTPRLDIFVLATYICICVYTNTCRKGGGVVFVYFTAESLKLLVINLVGFLCNIRSNRECSIWTESVYVLHFTVSWRREFFLSFFFSQEHLSTNFRSTGYVIVTVIKQTVVQLRVEWRFLVYVGCQLHIDVRMCKVSTQW